MFADLFKSFQMSSIVFESFQIKALIGKFEKI